MPPVLAAILFCLVGSAAAQNDNPIIELQGRIEALERQNQVLAEQLRRSQFHARPVNTIERLPAPVHEIHSVVDQYLRDLNAEQRDSGPEVYEIGENLDMTARWQNGGVAGFYVETPDKAFRVHVGGRTQTDFVFLSGDQAV